VTENQEKGLPSEDMQALAKAAASTFWGYLGCRVEQAEERRVIISLDVQDHHLNLIGILHGGVHAGLLDNAMGLVAMTARPREKVVTTNLNTQYVAPGGKGKVMVFAEVVHMSGRMITTQGRVESEDGELYALGTGSFRVI
jgi:uncharacterized protein (TIGR00369 family)